MSGVHCGPGYAFNPTYNSGYEDGRKAAKERIVDLERMLAAEKERAEYALRNLTITERARQEEMAKRDELLAALEAAVEWAMPMQEAPRDARPTWFDQSRAAIAKVKGKN